MPIYEYKCLSCDSHFEKMQKTSDEPFKTCEKCGGELEKQWSLSGFQFKGAGWYVTDYANKSGAAAEKSGKPEKTEKTEKSSAAESTVKTESASKQANDNQASFKKETVSKED